MPSADAARREAVAAAREILGEKLLHGGSLNHRTIEIANKTGRVVDVVNCHDVLYQHGRFGAYDSDVSQSAPVTQPRNPQSR